MWMWDREGTYVCVLACVFLLMIAAAAQTWQKDEQTQQPNVKSPQPPYSWLWACTYRDHTHSGSYVQLTDTKINYSPTSCSTRSVANNSKKSHLKTFENFCENCHHLSWRTLWVISLCFQADFITNLTGCNYSGYEAAIKKIKSFFMIT